MQKFYDYNPDKPFDVSGESHRVSDKKVILNYTPLKGSITIKSGDITLKEATSKEDLKENEFFIDYSERTEYRGATQEVSVNVPDDTEIVVDYKGVSTIIFAKHMNEIKEHMESSDKFESDQKALNDTFAKKAELEEETTNRTNDTNALKQLVSAIPKFAINVVEELPTENISTTTIYLVKTGDEVNNVYTEYIYVDEKWETLGKQDIDLSPYVKKTDKIESASKADTSDKLSTPRAVSLSGDVTGKANFDGSSDIDIKTTVNQVQKALTADSATTLSKPLSADNVVFSDGQTFQQKLNSGLLKGDKGDKGDTGETGPQGPRGYNGSDGSSGIDSFDINVSNSESYATKAKNALSYNKISYGFINGFPFIGFKTWKNFFMVGVSPTGGSAAFINNDGLWSSTLSKVQN